MLGAILGDMVGSPFEFDHNNYKHKDFPLLSEKSHFTDDTVMTVAVARGLMAGQGCTENLCRGAAQTQAVFKKRRSLPEEQQNTRLRIVCKAQYMGGCGFVVVCSHCQNRSKHKFCGVPSSRYRI